MTDEHESNIVEEGVVNAIRNGKRDAKELGDKLQKDLEQIAHIFTPAWRGDIDYSDFFSALQTPQRPNLTLVVDNTKK